MKWYFYTHIHTHSLVERGAECAQRKIVINMKNTVKNIHRDWLRRGTRIVYPRGVLLIILKYN